jgi:Uma2 family endonuclease
MVAVNIAEQKPEAENTSDDFGSLYVTLPPTQDELPSDDGIPMETQRHRLQMELLIDPLSRWLKDKDAYVGGNMFVYYSLTQVKNQDFKGPDFFAVLNVPRCERKSWVVWEEGKAPDVVIELLSESTSVTDKNEKKQIYQSKLRVPEYFWFDPFNPDDWQGFRLEGGTYQPLPKDKQGRLISQELGLALVCWQGKYTEDEIETSWLRWATIDGELLPTQAEVAEQEKLRADREKLRADREQQRADRLAEQLKSLGVNPDDI